MTSYPADRDMDRATDRAGRRRFLRWGGAALAGAALLPLAACGGESASANRRRRASALLERRSPSDTFAPDVERRLVAQPSTVELPGGPPWETWTYGGQYPGPEIRVKEGERLRVVLENELPGGTGTTVHWHGVPVPNAMDGVPGLTQRPVPPGESFAYEFEAASTGIYMYHYMYHSHRGLQLDRGLIGPLIIEERTPHVEYDREHTVILDDFLPGPPQTLEELVGSGEDAGGNAENEVGGGGVI